MLHVSVFGVVFVVWQRHRLFFIQHLQYIQQWFLAGVRKRCPDTVKPLNHDQAQKLVVEMVEESEEDTFFDMEDEI